MHKTEFSDPNLKLAISF